MKKEGFAVDIEKEIEAYQPFNEQEEKDKILILEALRNEKAVFTRENALAHMTASAWVTNPSHDKVLMVYHNIYNSWSWLGGHADGETDLLSVAIREVKEESGVKDVKPLSNSIFSLEVLTVDGHIKRGHYVSSHLHLNVSYLLEVDDHDPLFVKPDENSGVRWFSLQGAIDASTEPWFQEHIYSKLNAKLARFLQEMKP
jgi:8-oxo-dGTP pyrophosphatase MutT (NUDIX family)